MFLFIILIFKSTPFAPKPPCSAGIWEGNHNSIPNMAKFLDLLKTFPYKKRFLFTKSLPQNPPWKLKRKTQNPPVAAPNQVKNRLTPSLTTSSQLHHHTTVSTPINFGVRIRGVTPLFRSSSNSSNCPIKLRLGEMIGRLPFTNL